MRLLRCCVISKTPTVTGTNTNVALAVLAGVYQSVGKCCQSGNVTVVQDFTDV